MATFAPQRPQLPPILPDAPLDAHEALGGDDSVDEAQDVESE